MRFLIASTFTDIAALAGKASVTLAEGTQGHAITAALAAAHERDIHAMTADDADELDYAALMAAAQDSLAALSGTPDAPRLRAVVVYDVPEATLVPQARAARPAPASAVTLAQGVAAAGIVCAFVDEPSAEPVVRAALDSRAADDAALDDADLLWYDVTEFAAIPGVPVHER